MKMKRIIPLMVVFVCVNVQAMEKEEPRMPVGRMSIEEKFFRGLITPQEYLLSIENKPTEWGSYAAVVRALRTADYSNHHFNGETGFYLNLYVSLLNTLAVMRTYKDLIDLAEFVLMVKIKISEYQGFLENGIADGTIKEGRSGG